MKNEAGTEVLKTTEDADTQVEKTFLDRVRDFTRSKNLTWSKVISPIHVLMLSIWIPLQARPIPLPVVVSVTKRSYWDGKRLPNRVQIVLDHLSLVADCEPGHMNRKLNIKRGLRRLGPAAI